MIEWGAMQFLEEASTQRTSARRLKQWLLLALRMLAVLLSCWPWRARCCPGTGWGERNSRRRSS